jgi:hypothetical protein
MTAEAIVPAIIVLAMAALVFLILRTGRGGG